MIFKNELGQIGLSKVRDSRNEISILKKFKLKLKFDRKTLSTGKGVSFKIKTRKVDPNEFKRRKN